MSAPRAWWGLALLFGCAGEGRDVSSPVVAIEPRGTEGHRDDPDGAAEGHGTPIDRAAKGSASSPLVLRVEARPVKMGAGFGLDLTLNAEVTGVTPVTIDRQPAPHVAGLRFEAGAERSAFADGCYAAAPTTVAPGEARRFERRIGAGPGEAVPPGQSLRLEVGLCDVALGAGERGAVRAATVTLTVAPGGRPTVTIEAPARR